MSDNEQVQIFDGCNRVTVPKCCDGKVYVREVRHADAYRNLVDASHVVSQTLHCKTCGKTLNPTVIPDRPPLPERRKKRR